MFTRRSLTLLYECTIPIQGVREAGTVSVARGTARATEATPSVFATRRPVGARAIWAGREPTAVSRACLVATARTARYTADVVTPRRAIRSLAAVTVAQPRAGTDRSATWVSCYNLAVPRRKRPGSWLA